MTVYPLKTDFNVYINGEILPGLTGVKTDEIGNEKFAYEFLSDEAWAVIASIKKYIITLVFSGERPALSDSVCTLSVEKENSSTTYSECCIKSVEEHFSEGKLKTTVKIVAGEKE